MATGRKTAYNFTGSFLAVTGFLFFVTFFLFTVVGIGDVGMGKLFGNEAFLIALAVIILATPIVAGIYFKNDQSGTQEYISRSVIRYAIAFLMFFYGYTKLYSKFFEITYLAQDSRLADLDSFSLVWFFYGRSNVQEFLIGLMEFIPAVLLLFRRTSFLAAVLILPVAGNVMMVNIFNHVSGFTFPLSIYITLADVYLLYKWRFKIAAFLTGIPEESPESLNKVLKIGRWVIKLIILSTIAYFIIATQVLNRLQKNKQNYNGRNKIKGGFELYRLQVNGSTVVPQPGNSRYYKSIYLEPQSRWNCILDFSAEYKPRAITVKWKKDNDTVVTFLKKENSVTTDAVDTATMFKGTYRLKGDTLIINGMQYGSAIHATYIKKDLYDYKWFW